MKAPKKAKPTRRGIAFVALDADGLAYMQTRPERGMLGGMLGFPSAGWTDADPAYDPDDAMASAPFDAEWALAGQQVSHVFTHFALEMDVAVARLRQGGDGPEWQRVRAASLPTLMRKVWDAAKRG